MDEHGNLLEPVHSHYSSVEMKGQLHTQLSRGESQELLVKLANIHIRTVVCIDALDELEPTTRLHLMSALKYLIDNSTNLIKIFVTSRNDTDILNELEMFPRIDVEPTDNNNDIIKFVRERIEFNIDHKLLLEGAVSEDLKKRIHDSICERSDGM